MAEQTRRINNRQLENLTDVIFDVTRQSPVTALDIE